MTRTLLIALLIAVFAGCDTITTEQSQGKLYSQPDDVLMIAKKSPEDANRACRINPYRRKCAEWCASPESDCGEVTGEPKAAFDYSTDELEVQFTNDSKNADSYSWDFGDGSGTTQENPSHTYAQEGTYSVTLTVTNEDGTDSQTKPVTVSEDVVDPCEDGCPPPDDTSGMLDVNGTWPIVAGIDVINPGDKVCFIGYSNSAQIANKFIAGDYGDFTGATFVNAALGSHALERWAQMPSLLDRCGSDVDVVMSQVSSQADVPDEAGIANQIRTWLPVLHNNIRSRFPNAIIAHYQGEPAHWVNASKRWAIREPARYLHGKYIVEFVRGLKDPRTVLGPYLHNTEGEVNLSGEGFTRDDYAGTNGDNQHPNDNGREKASRIIAWWFSQND